MIHLLAVELIRDYQLHLRQNFQNLLLKPNDPLLMLSNPQYAKQKHSFFVRLSPERGIQREQHNVRFSGKSPERKIQ